MNPASAELFHILSAETGPGEHILWSGQPDPSVSMMSKWVIVPFAIFWLSISLAGLMRSLRDGNEMLSAFVSIFLAIGVYMLLSPIHEYLDARGTIFAITERRLIVVRRKGRSVKSILLHGVRQVERIRKRRGITLRIPTSLVTDGEGGRVVNYLDLHGLKDGEQAYTLLTGGARSAT